MHHCRRLAMHRVIEHAELAAKRLHDSLQAQTYAENRNAGAGGEFHEIRHTKIGWSARSWRNQNELRLDLENKVARNSGGVGDYFGAGLARIIGKRVNEAIVVVDQQ